MQSDTDLVAQIRDYLRITPFVTAYDTVRFFEARGIPQEKVLFVLREINDS